jgi:hypothetical protein
VPETPHRDQDQPLPRREEVVPTVRDGLDAPRTLPASREGVFGDKFFLYRRGPALVQYSRSFEDLEGFARNQNDPAVSSPDEASLFSIPDRRYKQ